MRVTDEMLNNKINTLNSYSNNKYKLVFANGYVSINIIIGKSALETIQGGLSKSEAYNTLCALVNYIYYETR